VTSRARMGGPDLCRLGDGRLRFGKFAIPSQTANGAPVVGEQVATNYCQKFYDAFGR
jgi:hypothetical protein